MLESLSSKLKAAMSKITMGHVDKAAVDLLIAEIRRGLIAGDVNVKLVEELCNSIEKKAFDKLSPGVTRREHIIKIVYEELTRILGSEKPEISLKPKKILLCGLFGSGKTSTAARIARYYKKHGLRCSVVCCDVVRPAAYEQLEQLAKRIDVQFYGEKGEKNAASIVKNALRKLKSDIIIIDSSGRDALNKEMIDEIKAINDVLKPDEKILILPADIGQAAKDQADAFHAALGISDVIVTKMDATGKGGGALTACYATGAKVKFITTGETPDDMEIYDAKRFVTRLLGMPDIETIVEKAKAAGMEKKAEKIIKSDFTIEEFYEQLEGMQQMGSMTQLAEMMGIGGKLPKDVLEHQQSKMKKWKHILNSMNSKERNNPEIIDASRTKRIAKGSGTSEAEVKELFSSYHKMKKMTKQLGLAKIAQGRGGIQNIMKMLKGRGFRI